MAEKIYAGLGGVIAQVNTETPANVTTADVYTIVLSDTTGATHPIAFTVTTPATVKAVVDALKIAADAAASIGHSPWDEVTVTEDDSILTITADVAGVPFFVVASVSGTGTLTDAILTPVEGPGFPLNADNWVGDVAPVDGDSVVFPAGLSVSIYGQDMTVGGTINFVGFTIEEGVTSSFGNFLHPIEISLKHSGSYYDANLGGTGGTWLDITNYGDIIVTAAGTGGIGTFGLDLTGTMDAIPEQGTRGYVYIDCSGGQKVSVGATAGDDMQVNFLAVSGGIAVAGDDVTQSDDSSAPSVSISGGELTTRCAVGAVIKTGGTWTHEGSGATLSLAANGGTTYYNGSGTLTTTILRGNETFSLSNNLPGCSITNIQMAIGTKLFDPNRKGSYGNGIDLEECGIEDVTITYGKHYTVDFSLIV